MAQDTTTLTTLYKGWDVYQEYLVKAVAPLTQEQLAFSLAPGVHTAGWIAAHIAFGRALWMNKVMAEGRPELAEIAKWSWEYTGYPDNAAGLVQALEVTWQDLQSCLARWTLDDLAHVYKGQYLDQPYEFTRQWVIWHLIEHDMHHGGELSIVLGAQGLAAVDLDRRS
jgi:uncharacterized damage-inducible protein DinB